MVKVTAVAAVAATVAASLSGGAEAQCSTSQYYSSTVRSQFSSQTGSSLQSTINNLVRGHRVLPYTSSSTDVWDALKQTDAYGMNPASGFVYLIYGNKAVSAGATLGNGASGTWNREHLWPKSYQVGSSGADYTDLHNLRASDADVNAARGNLYFDNCGGGCSSPAHFEAAFGSAKNSAVFMPPANVRGDIARAMFYMAARYDGRDSGTIDLELSNCPNSGAGFMGKLDTLLAWHRADPVNSLERSRNDVVCSFQENRNPFVDFPELVDRVYNSLSDRGCSSRVAESGEEEDAAALSTEATVGIAAAVGGLVAVVALVILAVKRRQTTKDMQSQDADEGVVSVNPMHASV